MSEKKVRTPIFSLWTNRFAFFALLALLAVLGFGKASFIFNDHKSVEIQGKDFHSSIRNGNFEQVKVMLDRGIDPNVRDDGNRTALYVATMSGSNDIATLLVARGASANVKDASGLENRIGTELNDPMRRYLEALDKQKFAQVREVTPPASVQ